MGFLNALARVIRGFRAPPVDTSRVASRLPPGPLLTSAPTARQMPPLVPAPRRISFEPEGPPRPVPVESFMSVAGESHYQPALRALVPAGSSADYLAFTATLKPEPDNAWDPHAIVVLGPGAQILGYLPRDVAKRYQRQLLTLGQIDCPAELRGGDEARLSIGVVLHWTTVDHTLSAIKVTRRARVKKPVA